jgi:hypothetical protein
MVAGYLWRLALILILNALLLIMLVRATIGLVQMGIVMELELVIPRVCQLPVQLLELVKQAEVARPGLAQL